MSTSANRLKEIAPFHVVELLTRAQELEALGRDIIHMEVGEPDFPTPSPIIDAAVNALKAGKTRYTPALGLPELREAISRYYSSRFNTHIPAERIIVTNGASGALNLVFACLTNPEDEWLVTDPGYPCNKHILRTYEGRATSIIVGAENNFQPTEEQINAHWTQQTRGLLLASPSNPTGTMLTKEQIKSFDQLCNIRGGHFIVDEIYQGLNYEIEPFTACSISKQLWVINSFSKYFQMTGWRLGWLIAPETHVRDLEKLAQNLTLCPSTPAQFAALAAFTPEVLNIAEERRKAFKARRDFLKPALENIGFNVVANAEGAFYLYCDCSSLSDNSFKLAQTLLEQIGVAVTPGIDFGHHQAEKYIRFAYTNEIPRLEEAISRLAQFFRGKNPTR